MARRILEINTKEATAKRELPFYYESKSYFREKSHKEQDLTVSNSIIFGKMRSVLSVGSVNGRDDAEMNEVLDILRG